MVERAKVFVTPGPGRKVPLPIPGGGLVPAEGDTVVQTTAVTRLIASGDLVVGKAPEGAPPVTKSTARNKAAPAAAEPAKPAAPEPAVPAVKGEK